MFGSASFACTRGAYSRCVTDHPRGIGGCALPALHVHEGRTGSRVAWQHRPAASPFLMGGCLVVVSLRSIQWLINHYQHFSSEMGGSLLWIFHGWILSYVKLVVGFLATSPMARYFTAATCFAKVLFVGHRDRCEKNAYVI